MLYAQHRDADVSVGELLHFRRQAVHFMPEQDADRKARGPVEQVHTAHAGFDRRDLIPLRAQPACQCDRVGVMFPGHRR